MNYIPRGSYLVLGALVGLAGASAATAGTALFAYTVVGQGNPSIDSSGTLNYMFVPDGPVATPLGALLVNYSGAINLILGSGPTMALWSVGALGTFSGPGVEFVLPADPVTLIAPFYGTSTITAGTGIFAGASGMTSYTGTFNVATGVTTFRERIEISGANVPDVPEPVTWLMMVTGFGLIGVTARRRVKRDALASHRL